MTNPPNDPAGYGSGGVRDVGDLPPIARPSEEPERITYPPTPENDKQTEIINSGKAELVQDFIEWLFGERHYELCVPKPDSLHGYYVPASYGSPEQLMADFFGVDRDKIETERRAILAAIRGES